MHKVNIIKKWSQEPVAKYLNASEIKCKCSYKDCNHTLFSDQLKGSWEKSREEFGAPLKITSGFRCMAHNRDVGGVKRSSHMTGEALDIDHSSMGQNEAKKLLKILNKNFDLVLIYRSFYHCHNLV